MPCVTLQNVTPSGSSFNISSGENSFGGCRNVPIDAPRLLLPGVLWHTASKKKLFALDDIYRVLESDVARILITQHR